MLNIVRCFFYIFEIFKKVLLKMFCHLGVFCTINLYFEYGIRILCIFCTYEHILKIFPTCFDNKIETNPRSVNNSRTNYLFDMFWDFGPKWSPYAPYVVYCRALPPYIYIYIYVYVYIYIYRCIMWLAMER